MASLPVVNECVLTYMATLVELQTAKILHKIEVRLKSDEFEDRRIYAFDQVITFVRDRLPNETAVYPENSSPSQQLFALMKRFITGGSLSMGEHFWLMRPSGADVFELRTPDLRMFGWVYSPGTFIATNLATFEDIHTLNNHAAYRDEAVRMRESLDLDDPKFTPAAEINNVVPF